MLQDYWYDIWARMNSHQMDILDLVSEATEKLLIAEGLILKRLGIDDVPIPVNDKQTEFVQEIQEGDQQRFRFLLEYDKGQEVQELVKEFAVAATSAVVSLHKEIEVVPQNRPFGGSTAVERLLMENLGLMNEILKYDDISSADYYTTKPNTLQ